MSLLTGLTSEYKVRKNANLYVTLRNDTRMHIDGFYFCSGSLLASLV